MKYPNQQTLVYKGYTIDLVYDGNTWTILVDQVLLMTTVRLTTAKRIAIKAIDHVLSIDSSSSLEYYSIGLRRANYE